MISQQEAELQRKLSEAHTERVKAMDELCELLSDISSTKLTSMFNASAGFVQKRLAKRYDGVRLSSWYPFSAILHNHW